MEDLPESDTIQLPNVNAAILNKVIQFCEFHKNDPPPLEKDDKKEKRMDDEVRRWDTEFMKANQEVLYDLSLAANYMGIESLLDLTTPIRQLSSELLVKVIEKLPRPQWTAFELVDHKSQDATLLAWESIRRVDIERDFIYSESKLIEDKESDRNLEVIGARLCRQIAGKTESILSKLSEWSPFITSLGGLSLMAYDDRSLNTTAVQYLSGFEHLETVKFANKHLWGRIVNGGEHCFSGGIPLINFVEFIESTQSRATLNEIDIEQCVIPCHPPVAANFDQRLRAAFANVPTRPQLQLESFSMRTTFGGIYPFTFFDVIDASQLTKLSLKSSHVEPASLTTLINGAPQLRHLDFAFLWSCNNYTNTSLCQGVHLLQNKELLAALETHKQLTSLGFDRIWNGTATCACHRFEAEFKKMLRSIAPQLVNLVFKPEFLPPDIRMTEVRDIIQRHMPNLNSITLDACCAEHPEELRGIADYKKLKEIQMAFADSSINNQYWGILDEVMSTIISKSPRLKRFIGINYYQDQRAVVELCKLTDLVDLRIRADRLTEENLVAFSQQVFVEKLEILDLGTGQAVELGLIELIGKATQLRELVVGQKFSDKLLECVAESCPNLEKFSASSADGIKIGGVQLLVDRCTKLRWLRVEDADLPLRGALRDMKLDHYRKLELEFGF